MSALDLERVRLNQLRQFLLRRLGLVNRKPELLATKRISTRTATMIPAQRRNAREPIIFHHCLKSMDVVDIDR